MCECGLDFCGIYNSTAFEKPVEAEKNRLWKEF